jgi:hypothetical protein
MSFRQVACTEAINKYTLTDYQEQPKKMNFIERWFAKKSKEAWDNAALDRSRVNVTSSVEPIGSSNFNLAAEGLNITIYGATGGQIVEFRRYDNKRDRNESKVYVIPTEQNFVESFSKIVSMEMIR